MSRDVESTRTSGGVADAGSVAGAAAGAAAAGAAGLPGPVSAGGTAAGAPPGSATGSFDASLIVPCRGNYEAGLSARPTRMSASALGRGCTAGSGAYPSPSTSSRALWRCVLVCAWCWRAFVRATASRVDCLAPLWSRVAKRKRKRPTGLVSVTKTLPKTGRNRAARTARRIISRLIASVPSPIIKKKLTTWGAVDRSPRGARRRCRRIVFDDTAR